MNAYYSSTHAASSLIAEAHGWVGTPFAPYAALKGVGVDCIHLAAELYARTGALPDSTLPFYNLDHSVHHASSDLFPQIEAFGRFLRVWDDKESDDRELPDDPLALMVGDLFCFRFGAAPFHLGVHLGQRLFIHVMARRTVMVSTLEDSTWRSRLVRIYRPTA